MVTTTAPFKHPPYVPHRKPTEDPLIHVSEQVSYRVDNQF